MSNIRVTTPSFVFGYWRPWNENSNLTESYLNYVKDVSLVKYGADVVGKYVKEASQEQVSAISKLGNKIGSGIDLLSNKLDDVNEELRFLNANTEILIEQQKLSNILLEDIIELLRVPDSEKERQHAIELGIKFFVNAQKDHTLFDDALEQLQKAEVLMKQDYFVLHRIGCIHLYVEKHLDIKKAKDYFLRSAKYSSVENNEDAINLANILTSNKSSNTKRFNDIEDFIDKINLEDYPELNKLNVLKISYDDTDEEIIVAKKNSHNKIIDVIPLLQLKYSQNNSALNKEVQLIIDSVDEINSNYQNFNKNSIDKLTADSYQKAAFCSYVLGEFEKSVSYQQEATDLVNNPENLYLLAKYQVRNNQVGEAIVNLNNAIDLVPAMALAVFKEIDLLHTQEILELIEKKNEDICQKINGLIEEWRDIKSKIALSEINHLNLALKSSYDIKVASYNKSKEILKETVKKIDIQKQEIDETISEFKSKAVIQPTDDLIDYLSKSKDLTLDEMELRHLELKETLNKIAVKIGSHYQGGVVFYLDESGKHGLVFAEYDVEECIWGANGTFKTEKVIGSGKSNTEKIIKYASYREDIKWFKRIQTPIQTAARVCFELNHNGFNDWFLPSINELELLYKNIHKPGIHAFKTDKSYWSSSEVNELLDENDNDGWRHKLFNMRKKINFHDTNPLSLNKFNSYNAWHFDFKAGNASIGLEVEIKAGIWGVQKELKNESRNQHLRIIPVRSF